MSKPVKFDEKSQIVKPAGNYPYYFLERAEHVCQVMYDICWIGLIC